MISKSEQRRRQIQRHQASIYHDLPRTVDKIDLISFTHWLREHDATVLEPTNDYEVMRWRPNGQPVVLFWRNNNGQITWSPDAAQTYRAFLNNRDEELQNGKH